MVTKSSESVKNKIGRIVLQAGKNSFKYLQFSKPLPYSVKANQEDTKSIENNIY